MLSDGRGPQDHSRGRQARPSRPRSRTRAGSPRVACFGHDSDRSERAGRWRGPRGAPIRTASTSFAPRDWREYWREQTGNRVEKPRNRAIVRRPPAAQVAGAHLPQGRPTDWRNHDSSQSALWSSGHAVQTSNLLARRAPSSAFGCEHFHGCPEIGARRARPYVPAKEANAGPTAGPWVTSQSARAASAGRGPALLDESVRVAARRCRRGQSGSESAAPGKARPRLVRVPDVEHEPLPSKKAEAPA